MGYGPVASEGELSKGLIVLVSPNQLDRKGNNKVSKCKLRKYLFGEKNESEFRYSMTITNSLLVAQPIKMQDLHQSTGWVILIKVSQVLIISLVLNLPLKVHCFCLLKDTNIGSIDKPSPGAVKPRGQFTRKELPQQVGWATLSTRTFPLLIRHVYKAARVTQVPG